MLAPSLALNIGAGEGAVGAGLFPLLLLLVH